MSSRWTTIYLHDQRDNILRYDLTANGKFAEPLKRKRQRARDTNHLVGQLLSGELKRENIAAQTSPRKYMKKQVARSRQTPRVASLNFEISNPPEVFSEDGSALRPDSGHETGTLIAVSRAEESSEDFKFLKTDDLLVIDQLQWECRDFFPTEADHNDCTFLCPMLYTDN